MAYVVRPSFIHSVKQKGNSSTLYCVGDVCPQVWDAATLETPVLGGEMIQMCLYIRKCVCVRMRLHRFRFVFIPRTLFPLVMIETHLGFSRTITGPKNYTRHA